MLVPELTPYLLITSDKVALPLCPMIFWWQDVKGQLYEHGRCHLFDFAAKDGSSFSFKTVGQANELIVSRNDPHLGELASELAAQRSEDGPVEAVRIVAVHCEEK